MPDSQTSPKVDAFLDRADPWRAEFEALRRIILACGLDEDLKWGQPCYAHQGGNVVLMHGFKDYVAILFFKGALLKDPAGVLVQQTQNVQAARQMRFTSVDDVLRLENVIADYIHEAIGLQTSGATVPFKPTQAFAMADEFKARLAQDPALRAAFEALTPGRQRGYLLYFAAAKQAKTRLARIEKCAPLILEGKGLDD
jgi:uncharacterized protein YdeI (YjbR/CyaY-like superfamily)